MEPRIRDEFSWARLNELGISRATEVARFFSTLLDSLESITPGNGRSMAIVRTKLQEASYFAKRAVAEQTENQETK